MSASICAYVGTLDKVVTPHTTPIIATTQRAMPRPSARSCERKKSPTRFVVAVVNDPTVRATSPSSGCWSAAGCGASAGIRSRSAVPPGCTRSLGTVASSLVGNGEPHAEQRVARSLLLCPQLGQRMAYLRRSRPQWVGYATRTTRHTHTLITIPIFCLPNTVFVCPCGRGQLQIRNITYVIQHITPALRGICLKRVERAGL